MIVGKRLLILLVIFRSFSNQPSPIPHCAPMHLVFTSPPMNTPCRFYSLLMLLLFASVLFAQRRFADDVSPLVGTQGEGNTFPVPSHPLA